MHPKIKELRKNARPISYGGMAIRADGSLTDNELTVENNIIKGYACVWNIPDDYGTYWIRGAFAKSINDRGPESNSKYKITLLWQHELRNPIGRITVLREDDYGLYFESELDTGGSVIDADRALQQINSGTINQFSFGFNYIWDKLFYNEALGLVEVREAELMEISPVTKGSQMETYAIRSADDYEDALVELNIKTEAFIGSIPRAQQYELRQLIANHIALRESKPVNVFDIPLGPRQPQAEIDYGFLNDNFKL